MKYIYLNGLIKYFDDKCLWVLFFFLVNMIMKIMIGIIVIINV